jgi:hypothetical protein
MTNRVIAATRWMMKRTLTTAVCGFFFHQCGKSNHDSLSETATVTRSTSACTRGVKQPQVRRKLHGHLNYFSTDFAARAFA